jgi:hypothetical protein
MRYRIPILIAAAFGAAVAAPADQNAAGARHPMGPPLRGLERCLASADISTEARGNAQAALTAGREVLKTDGAAMKAAHEKMQADIANGADKSAIGQDAIDANAARTKLQTDAQTIHDQALAALSPDEQSAVSACMAAHEGHWKRGHAGAPTSTAPGN